MDYAGRGIQVNAVLPGVIDTPMLRSALKENGCSEDKFAAAFSQFKLGQGDEVAEAVAWLCSDPSSLVTGHSLAVDGGYLAL